MLRDQYWRTGDGFLFVFDLTNQNSFDILNQFYDAVVKAKEMEPLPIVLCGNKCDIDREQWKVSSQQMDDLAKQHSWAQFETSAKNELNVSEALEEVVRRMIKFRTFLNSGGANGGGVGGDGADLGADGHLELNDGEGGGGGSGDGKKKNMKTLLKSLFKRKK